MEIKNLAIICGSGEISKHAIKQAIDKKLSIYIYYIIEEHTSFPDYKEVKKITGVHILKFGALVKELKKDKISHVFMIGKVQKENIFKKIKIDLKTITLLAKMKNQDDSSFFKVLDVEFKKNKIEILSQKHLLSSLLLPKKIYSKQKPNKKDLESIKYGLQYAKAIANLDIGQTVVIKNKAILAIEAIEGTDQCILRTKQYNKKPNAIVCKVSRPQQDERFDIPTIGIQTIENMKEAGCKILAIEANYVFVYNLEEVLLLINKYKMILGAF